MTMHKNEKYYVHQNQRIKMCEENNTLDVVNSLVQINIILNEFRDLYF